MTNVEVITILTASVLMKSKITLFMHNVLAAATVTKCGHVIAIHSDDVVVSTVATFDRIRIG